MLCKSYFQLENFCKNYNTVDHPSIETYSVYLSSSLHATHRPWCKEMFALVIGI